jgi:hypothetical protein
MPVLNDEECQWSLLVSVRPLYVTTR